MVAALGDSTYDEVRLQRVWAAVASDAILRHTPDLVNHKQDRGAATVPSRGGTAASLEAGAGSKRGRGSSGYFGSALGAQGLPATSHAASSTSESRAYPAVPRKSAAAASASAFAPPAAAPLANGTRGSSGLGGAAGIWCPTDKTGSHEARGASVPGDTFDDISADEPDAEPVRVTTQTSARERPVRAYAGRGGEGSLQMLLAWTLPAAMPLHTLSSRARPGTRRPRPPSGSRRPS